MAWLRTQTGICSARPSWADTSGNPGSAGYGELFELPRTAGGYASVPTTPVSFIGMSVGRSIELYQRLTPLRE